jgi:hypothetical protein
MLSDKKLYDLAEALHSQPNRIQGFSLGDEGCEFWVRDVYRSDDSQVLWEGHFIEEMQRQIRFHKMKLAAQKVKLIDVAE